MLAYSCQGNGGDEVIAGCYIRVSTEDQTEYSPDAQLRAIKEYCKKNNITLDSNYIYRDEGFSGKTAEKRPAFMRMIRDAKTKPFDIILVHKFDRFARNMKDSIIYKELLRKDLGIELISITEDFGNDKNSFLTEGIKDIFNAWYSINLGEEVKKGLKEKVLKGEPVTMPSLGYRSINKRYEIIEDEANTVRLIFNKFVNGDGLNKISRYLNLMNIKTRKGNNFSGKSINDILNNPIYIGKIRWTPNKDAETLVVNSSHQPIIPIELWNKAQLKIAENRDLYCKYHKTSIYYRHWLCGLVRCGECGRTLVIHNSGNCDRDYFQCNGYAKGSCATSHSIPLLRVEKLILNQLRTTYSTSIKINFKEKNGKQDELSILKSKLNKINEKEQRIKEAYKNGIDTLEEYKQNKIDVKLEKESLENEISSLNVNDTEKKVRIECKNLYNLLKSDTIEMKDKIKFSHSLIEKIVFDKQRYALLIYYKIDT